MPGLKKLDLSLDEADRLARRFSPLHHVAEGAPPTLIVHGTDDPIVPYEQAEQFDQRMTDEGNDCELLTLEDTKHAFVIPGYADAATLKRAIDAADTFLTDLGYLGAPPEP